MATVKLEQKVNAPLDVVWSVWDDYTNIAKFHPLLNSSHGVGDAPETGLGAKRQCNLNDGKTWLQEEIIEYIPNKKIVIDVYGGNMPLKKAEATFYFDASGSGETNITMIMDFVPGMGLLGKLMIPMMKMKFSSMLGLMLRASAEYTENMTAQAA